MNKGEKMYLVGKNRVIEYEYIDKLHAGHVLLKDGHKAKVVSDEWLEIALYEGFTNEQDALKTWWLIQYEGLTLLEEQAGITKTHINAWEWYKKHGWGLGLPKGKVEIENVLKLYNEQSI
jgi:hypothetical protein